MFKTQFSRLTEPETYLTDKNPVIIAADLKQFSFSAILTFLALQKLKSACVGMYPSKAVATLQL